MSKGKNYQLQCWPIIVILFLVTIIIFNIFFFIKARSTYLGLVEERPYAAGLSYENIIQKINASRTLGIKFRAELTGHELRLYFNKELVSQGITVEVKLLKLSERHSEWKILSFITDYECDCLKTILDKYDMGSFQYELSLIFMISGEAKEYFESGVIILSSKGVIRKNNY